MKMIRFAALTAAMLFTSQSAVNAQETILGLDDNNGIVTVNGPSISGPTAVTGLVAGDSLVGIDYRSGNGLLYAVGSGSNLYTLDRMSFNATLLANFGADPAGPGALTGSSFAFDFNPALTTAGEPRGTFARIISDDDSNRVVNGNTGQYLGGDRTPVFYDDGTSAGTSGAVDDNFGNPATIEAIAYTNSVFAPTSTQQFGIDVEQDTLVTIANNDGVLGTVDDLTIAGVSVDITGDVGFDISGATGIGYVSFDLAGGVLGSDLYTIDVDSDDADLTLVGPLGLSSNIRSLTVLGPAAVPEPSSVALLGLGAIAFIGRRRRK